MHRGLLKGAVVLSMGLVGLFTPAQARTSAERMGVCAEGCMFDGGQCTQAKADMYCSAICGEGSMGMCAGEGCNPSVSYSLICLDPM